MEPVKAWFLQLRDDLTKLNQNRMAVICGRVGTGKSYTAISFGDILLGKNFDVKKHVAYFDPWNFLEICSKAKPGSVVVFDEVGVGMDSREWAKQSNIMITKILQTFRTKNLFVLFTAPDFSFVDIKARKLFHYFAVTRPIDFKREQTRSKWYDIITNPFTGEFYQRTLRIEVNKRPVEIAEIRTAKPPTQMCKDYERLRAKALTKLFGKADDMRTGGGRSVTVEQAANMWEIPSAHLWALIKENKIPLDRESSGVKIPLSYIRSHEF